MAIKLEDCRDSSAFWSMLPADLFSRLSVLVEQGGNRFIVTKGALSNVLDVCAAAETFDGKIVGLETVREQIGSEFKEWCGKGYRVLGLAYRNISSETHMTKDSEREMTFLGFLVFYDPLRDGINQTIASLRGLGVSLKLITGDNKIVAENIICQAGLVCSNIITGAELREMSNEALRQRVNQVDVFAEVEPNQKERIIRALKQRAR